MMKLTKQALTRLQEAPKGIMASKSVSIGDWKIKTLTDEDVKDLLALIRQAKNDNLDDEYAYKSYNRLETKIYRIALALQSL